MNKKERINAPIIEDGDNIFKAILVRKTTLQRQFRLRILAINSC